jgi:hypothetical protein
VEAVPLVRVAVAVAAVLTSLSNSLLAMLGPRRRLQLVPVARLLPPKLMGTPGAILPLVLL